MKLNNLQLSVSELMNEEVLPPDTHEKLGYLAMMISRQGKDPDPIIKQIRSQVDKAFGAQEQGKSNFATWVKSAKQNESKEGKTNGRMVRITVLDQPQATATPGFSTDDVRAESRIGRMKSVTLLEYVVINEGGFLSNIGQMIISKLRDMVGDDAPESGKTKAALDEFPSLAAITRYAKQSQVDLSSDEKFWQLVDKLTAGKARQIQSIVDGLHEVEESRWNDKHAINEAKISEVMLSLGMKPEQVKEIMTSNQLQDTDFDLDRIKKLISNAGGSIKNAIKSVVPSAKPAGKAADPGKVKESNWAYALLVIKTAAALLKAEQIIEKQPNQSQGQTDKAMQQVANSIAKDPSIVDASVLNMP